uniref:CDP-alcohol phosphatidyltransferase family protein n=1 Tax=candidate division WOR-3 bacterium TaxID=2052148 RepID=A0A7C4XK73_UNCW3
MTLNRIKNFGRKFFVLPITKILAKFSIHPNSITIFSLFFSVFAFIFYRKGIFFLGGIFLFFSSILDTFDGELARQTNRITRFGGFLDSTVDRINEFVIYLGLFLYYYNRENYVLFWIFLALFGSLMVSYTRARAEGLGISPKVGIFERLVRLVFLIIGSFWGPKIFIYFLVIIALGTIQTTIHRIIYVYKRSIEIKENAKN